MPTKTRNVPQSDWDQHKETILKLYLTDDLSIPELVQAMQEHHGFSATVSQFEAKLRSWSARKNLKRHEWESIFEDVDPFESQGTRYRVLVSGHPLPMSRIHRARRHLKCGDRPGKRRRVEVKSTHTAGSGNTEEFVIEVQGHDGSWAQPTPTTSEEVVSGQPIADRSQELDLDALDHLIEGTDDFTIPLGDESVNSQYVMNIFSPRVRHIFPQFPLFPASDSTSGTWFSTSENEDFLGPTGVPPTGLETQVPELLEQHSNDANTGFLSPRYTVSTLRSGGMAWPSAAKLYLEGLPFEQLAHKLELGRFQSAARSSPMQDSQLLFGSHGLVVDFLIDITKATMENEEISFDESRHRVKTTLRGLKSMYPRTQNGAGSGDRNMIRRSDGTLEDTELIQLLLLSATNGFAGINNIPIGAVFKYLGQHGNITSLLSHVFQDRPDHAAKSLAENLFRAAIEAGDHQATRFLLKTGLVNVDETVCFVGEDKYTPLERAAELQWLKVVEELLLLAPDVNRTFLKGTASRFIFHNAKLGGALGRLISASNLRESSQGRSHMTFSPEYLAVVDALIKAGLKVSVQDILLSLRKFARMDLAKRLLLNLLPRDHSEAISNGMLNHISEGFTDEEATRAISTIISYCERTRCNQCMYWFGDEVNRMIVGSAKRGHCKLVQSVFQYARSPVQILCAAIRGGSRELVQFILALKPDIRHSSPVSIDGPNSPFDLTTPLAEAVDGGDDALIATLENEGVLEQFDNTTDGDYQLKLALSAAVSVGNLEYMKKLLSLTTNLNEDLISECFSVAVRCRQEVILQFIFENGMVPPQARDGHSFKPYKFGSKPLISAFAAAFPDAVFTEWSSAMDMLDFKVYRFNKGTLDMFQQEAIRRNDSETLHQLLERGADARWNYALQVASKGYPDMLRIILEHLLPIKYPIPNFGIDVLGEVLRQIPCDMETLDMLLTCRAIDFDGQEEYMSERKPRPLGIAIEIDAVRCCSEFPLTAKLLDAGCDVNKVIHVDRVNPHMTPLSVAIRAGNLNLVQFLIYRGANVNREATLGVSQTALQTAAYVGSLDIIQLLIRKGASVNEKPAGYRGGTAMQFAAMSGNCNIAAILLDNGANMWAPPSAFNGRWPLEGAAEHGRLDMIQFLWNASDFGFPIEQCQRAIKLAGENGHGASQDLIRKLAVSSGIMLTLEGTGLS
ncbi:ankyrin [Hypomontagnella monticulosa]|nr:ankyrin [Hypomontagnella monticulosa]